MAQRTGDWMSGGMRVGFAVGTLLTVFSLMACSRDEERSEQVGSAQQSLTPIAIRTFGFESLGTGRRPVRPPWL